MAGQLIVHYKKDDTKEVELAQIFGGDVPESDRVLKERVEDYYDDLGRGSLSSYVVTRANDNILIRPEAVFGKLKAVMFWLIVGLVTIGFLAIALFSWITLISAV